MAARRKVSKFSPDENGWAMLRAVGEEYDELQRSRIRAENRLRALGPDGVERLGVDVAGRLAELEADVGKALRVTYQKTVPDVIITWQREQLGLGDLQLARLLGHLGHPRIARPMRWEGEGAERTLVAHQPFERTVSQLVAYTGRTGDPARRKKVGMTAEQAFGMGKPSLKMLTFLIAGQMVKSGVRKTDATDDSDVYDLDNRQVLSPWAVIYLDQRRAGRDRLDWSLGHQHAAALHRVAKALVKELWMVAGADPELPALRDEVAAWRPAAEPKKIAPKKGSKSLAATQAMEPTTDRSDARSPVAASPHSSEGTQAKDRAPARADADPPVPSDTTRRRVVRRMSA